MKKSCLLVTVLLLTGCLVAPPAAFGKCPGPAEGALEERNHSALVFIGELISVDVKSKLVKHLTFRIIDTLKGKYDEPITLLVETTAGECLEPEFTVTKQYLIYAKKLPKSQMLGFSASRSNSRLVEDAANDLLVLKAGKYDLTGEEDAPPK